MAAGTIERLYKVTVDGTEAVRQLEKIAASTGAVDSKLDAFAGTLKKAGAALAAAFGVGIIVDRVKGLTESFDQLGKDAAKVGVAVGELQRLRFAADLAGVSAEKMDKALTALSSAMAALSTGTDDATRLLKDIGVGGADTATTALAKIADRFASMPDGIEKTAEAVALFGKKIGPDLIPLLNGGAAELAKLETKLDQFGGVIEQKTIDAAERFNDNLSMMGKTAAGAGAQFTAGLLSALDALAGAFVELVTTGDGFKSTGNAIGEVFVTLTKGAIYASQILRTFGKDIAFVFSLLTPGNDIGALWDAFQDDIRQTDAETKKLIDDLDKGFAAAKAGSDERTEAHKKERKTLADLAAAEEARKQAEAEAEKAGAEAKRAAARAAAEAAKLQEAYAKILRDTTVELEDQKQAEVGLAAARAAAVNTDKEAAAAQQRLRDTERELADAKEKTTASIDAQIKAQRDAELEMQAMIVLAQEGTEEQRKLAGAWLEHELAIKHMAPVVDEWKDVQNIMGAGFDRFVESLSTGSVTAAQAFRGMVQSIIADLLKLLAKKELLDAINLMVNGFSAGGAKGLVFEEGAVVPFARGGVLSGPVRLPMALMGEAGPEAVMPLKRGADGNLGVMAHGGAAPINVNINNMAGADISARRTGPQDIEIMVNRARDAIAADVRAGGTPVARALEQAYALGRGAAAPF